MVSEPASLSLGPEEALALFVDLVEASLTRALARGEGGFRNLAPSNEAARLLSLSDQVKSPWYEAANGGSCLR
jgi:hypothetical protein